jgi:hypothetical protein
MDGDQLTELKSSFINEVVDRSKERGAISGTKLTDNLTEQRSVLEAIGYTPADFANIEKLAAILRLTERRGGQQAAALVGDKPGLLMDFVARIAGSASARGAAKTLGVTGAVNSIILPQAGSRLSRTFLQRSIVDNAEELIKSALQPTPEGRALFAALMTRPTDSAVKRAEAGRQIHAWVVSLGEPATEGLRGPPEE